MIHRVIVDALFFFFSPRVMWKVWINLCILHHFDSETSHSFRSNFSQLICDKACLTLPRTFPFLFQNRFEIFRFIRMKCISSYYKMENSMIYRITWNVFFIQWVARGKHRLYLFCITLKWAKPFHMPRSASAPPGVQGFPAILQVMWHLDPLWLAHWPSCRVVAGTGRKHK